MATSNQISTFSSRWTTRRRPPCVRCNGGKRRDSRAVLTATQHAAGPIYRRCGSTRPLARHPARGNRRLNPLPSRDEVCGLSHSDEAMRGDPPPSALSMLCRGRCVEHTDTRSCKRRPPLTVGCSSQASLGWFPPSSICVLTLALSFFLDSMNWTTMNHGN